MEFQSPNGSPIIGTLETVRGVAYATLDETGSPSYEGETKIWWDEQRTVVREGGKIVYVDEAGNEWTFDQLIPAEGGY